jgi:ribosomal protein L31
MKKKYYNHLCRCGCGNKLEIKSIHKKIGVPLYIQGHNKSFTGRHHSDKTKRKIGKNVSKYFKGKSWIQLYGVLKAKKMRDKLSSSKKGYIMSDDTKLKLSVLRKGKKMSEQTKKKMSESRKGKIMDMVTRKKISIAIKGIKRSDDFRDKCKNRMLGTKHSKVTKDKISKSNMGRVCSEYTKKRISESVSDEKHPFWKGDKVGYNALHGWIRRNKPKPIFCEECKKNKSKDLSNISGNYKRDINDYRYLCHSCHMKLDFKSIKEKRVIARKK